MVPASIVEEQAFPAEVRPTISDYWRSPVPLAPVVRPSNQGCITTTSSKSPQLTTSFPQLEQQQKDGRVINTDQTTASALGKTHRCSVCASPRLDRGGTDRSSTTAVIHPTMQLHRLRYLHHYQPNHPPVFAQDDSLNHVATTYQKLGNDMIVISLERGGCSIMP